MSLWRRAARRDGTEREIINALVKAGAQVIQLGKFDLLVLYRNRLFMLDAKSRHGKPTDSQTRLTKEGWPLRYVETPEAALKVIGAIR